MSFEAAIRLTEILLAWALILQSGEHLAVRTDDRPWFVLRLCLSFSLLLGCYPPGICLALLGSGLWLLQRFQGPYNGGSDRMGFLILCCLCLALFLPGVRGREMAMGYLALQCVLSYFIAGWVKIANPEWRNGRALRDVFQFSAYPVSESFRAWADRPRTMCVASWMVMLFELSFPLCLISQPAMFFALAVAAGFHLVNACLFGLNRFFWIWLAAYPSLVWLQARITN